MASRAAQVRDAAAAAIRAAWSPTAPDAVTGVWAADIVLDPERPAEALAGRQVYVFCSALTQPRVLDRGGVVRRYAVSVLAVERYTSPGPVPAAWVDDRAEFVETTVFAVLAAPALRLLDGAVRLAMDEEHGVDAVCDRDLLQRNQTFWSVGTFVFQEVVTP